jgi:hypothetical protein
LTTAKQLELFAIVGILVEISLGIRLGGITFFLLADVHPRKKPSYEFQGPSFLASKSNMTFADILIVFT